MRYSCTMTRMLFGVVFASATSLVIIPMTILSVGNDCSPSSCQWSSYHVAGLRSPDNDFKHQTVNGSSSSIYMSPASSGNGPRPLPLSADHLYTGNKRFIFHPGKVSVGGDITDLPPAHSSIGTLSAATIEYLKYLCDRTPNCVGFTTDGMLKRMIRPFNNWTETRKEEQELSYNGLYTIDINYCESTEYHYCPMGTKCVNRSNGTYMCQSHVNVNLNKVIQVVVSVDTVLLPGLIALLQSIKVNCKRQTKIEIHIVVNTTDRQRVEDEVTCALVMTSNIKIHYLTFEIPASFKELIRVESHTYLKSTANFVRFFFADMFPTLSHILYLDADTIVQHDLSELWRQVIKDNDKLLVVVQRKFPRLSIHFPYGNVTSLFAKRYNQTLELSSPSFNAGVLGFNLNKWRKNRVIDEVIYWMEENSITPLWFQGTQPILYLVAFRDWKTVDERWNVEGLGWTKIPVKVLSKAYILHWNGPDKPWGRMDTINVKKRLMMKFKGLYDIKWRKYKKVKCSGKGVCSPWDNPQVATSRVRCICNHGYEGLLCERHHKN